MKTYTIKVTDLEFNGKRIAEGTTVELPDDVVAGLPDGVAVPISNNKPGKGGKKEEETTDPGNPDGKEGGK